MTTKKVPYTDPSWKITGYTGYIHGMQETYKQTPIRSQEACKERNKDTQFSQSESQSQLNNQISIDILKQIQPDNLWPNLQETAAQDSLKAPNSKIIFGDERINPYASSYMNDYDAPFESYKCLRSPMRNRDLAKTETSLKNHYISAYNRVGHERLLKMLSRMRERIQAKLGNSNDNAFKLRKLFKMYDVNDTKLIGLEDFRMMTGCFGMQLDDDSLLTLFNIYDPESTGYLQYEHLMSLLLDPDYFALYIGSDLNIKNELSDGDGVINDELNDIIKNKLSKIKKEDIMDIMKKFDKENKGYLIKKDFISACAILGIALTPEDLSSSSSSDNNMSDYINYNKFL